MAQPNAGIALLTVDNEGKGGILLTIYYKFIESNSTVRLWCAFTTPSFAIGYCSTEHPIPKVWHERF